MTEKMSLIQKGLFLAQAVQFSVERTNRTRLANNTYEFTGIEKLIFTLSRLNPERLQEIIRQFSSYNYGKHLLDQVFPRCDNPYDFNSIQESILLTENPVQVLGWQETDKLTQKGVDQGLVKLWIEIGFEERAEQRGIDTEWHFHENPKNIPGQNNPSNLLEP